MTTTPVGNGQFRPEPFVGNIIPTNRIHPVARRLLDLYRLPNAPGTPDGRNNFFLSGKALEDYWTTIGRFDHAFSDKHRMFVRMRAISGRKTRTATSATMSRASS